MAGEGLRLDYGSASGEPEDAAGIGQEIVGVVNRHGLKTEWSGSGQQPILVRLDWKRRRPARKPWWKFW